MEHIQKHLFIRHLDISSNYIIEPSCCLDYGCITGGYASLFHYCSSFSIN